VIKLILEDIKGMEEITDNLLLLSRIDSQKNPRSFEKFPFHEIVMSVFENACQSAYEKELLFDFDKMDHVEIYADKGLIRTMLKNLISNAVKYTPNGGDIKLSLRKVNMNAELTITDSGVGIPEDAQPFIFNRFFRVDSSRSLETGGTGLGLPLVQKIVEFHGGEINFESSPGKGSSFSVILPRVN
jgi:signal transduction histidine kinase